jgi:rubrerythrin
MSLDEYLLSNTKKTKTKKVESKKKTKKKIEKIHCKKCRKKMETIEKNGSLLCKKCGNELGFFIRTVTNAKCCYFCGQADLKKKEQTKVYCHEFKKDMRSVLFCEKFTALDDWGTRKRKI